MSTPNLAPIVQSLVDIQEREHWSDGQLAIEIGVSRPTWNLVRRGLRPMRSDWAMSAAGRFPELTRELLDMVPSRTERPTEAAL